MNTPITPGTSGRTPVTVPVGPMLSMFDPIFIGLDETGQPVYMSLIGRNILMAGEPGGGKSGLIQTIATYGLLCMGTRLVLLDGKQVELGMYRDLADVFVGPDLAHAIATLKRLQKVMDNRYAWLLAHRRRKISPADNANGVSIILALIDEIALYSATLGTKPQQEEFTALFRDLVARGRAAGIIVVAATQRPSVDIIPKSVRDLFGFRAAFRCASAGSSNIILGEGWAEAGFSATDIPPTNQGVCYLIAEGGVPRRIKVAYLTDANIWDLVEYASWIRRTNTPAQPRPALHVA